MNLPLIILARVSTHTRPEDLETAIKLPRVAGESTYFVAKLLMDLVKYITGLLGLRHDETVVSVLYVALVVVISIALGALIKWVLLKSVNFVIGHRPWPVMVQLAESKFFTRLSSIIPPVVMLILIQFSLSSRLTSVRWLEKCLWIYIIFCITLALNKLIDAIWRHIDARENKKHLPLKGLAQVVRVIIWFITIIIVTGIILSKSPATLLAGLGAFAAVLMLVFKDSILGVVAGVQLAENDMLRVGDWIAVDGTSANGNVTEVSLSSVKVLNWDKTTTTLPPYSLISGSFKNYRSMQRSGTRRISRTYLLDADTVRPLSEQDLNKFRAIPFMDQYITAKIKQKHDGKVANVNNPDGLADGTIDTNLGLLRAYLKMYLDSLPTISHEDDCFVNTLQQDGSGIPIQIYCFTSTSSWIPYEGIQSEIFEHLACMLPQFGLYVFENASGRDEINNGWLEAGGDANLLRGLPYPFLRDSAPTQPKK